MLGAERIVRKPNAQRRGPCVTPEASNPCSCDCVNRGRVQAENTDPFHTADGVREPFTGVGSQEKQAAYRPALRPGPSSGRGAGEPALR